MDNTFNGLRIAEKRKSLGFSQEQLANKLGVSQKALANTNVACEDHLMKFL